MNKIISFKQAAYLSTAILSLLSLFHLIVIIGIIVLDYVPNEFLWGGRIETRDEFLQFEIVSLIVSIFCIFIILVRSQSIKISALLGFSRVVLWLLFVLFTLNTIGNLIAESIFERGLALLTVILSVLCLKMALEPINKKT
jgi:hypothetical protein